MIALCVVLMVSLVSAQVFDLDGQQLAGLEQNDARLMEQVCLLARLRFWEFERQVSCTTIDDRTKL